MELWPRASVDELRRVQPNLSLARFAEHSPIRPNQREQFVEAPRRAGLE
jgi:hypothetical protein